MTNPTVELPHCVFDDTVETACRTFDMCLADRLAAAAEAGNGELLRQLLDLVAWIDSARHFAALSARLN